MSVDLEALAFRAETNPLGPAIDLVWELPDPDADADSLRVLVLRREGRFPGRSRRGVVAVDAAAADLADGLVVHDSDAFEPDLEETRDERSAGPTVTTTRQFLYRGSPRDRVLARTIRREPGRTTVRVVDRAGLEPQTAYYYTAFVGPARTFSRDTQAGALATGRGRHRLFELLPAIDRRRDDALPPAASVERADAERGQLERFLGAVDAHADLLLGQVESLRDLRSPCRIDARLLPALAALVGWRLKDYLDEEGQRNEIAFAPEVYRTLGTAPNVAAIVNRLTGWDTRVREFARHVVLSADTSRVETLDAGPAYLDGSVDASAGPLTASRVPFGSVDTRDALATFRLRNRAFEDATAYTYDVGRPLPDGGYELGNDDWFNRETIGVYVVPDVETEAFTLEQEWTRIREILAEFLPIGVRAIVVLLPGVSVEEPYDATQAVVEGATDAASVLDEDAYGEGDDAAVDRVPEWRYLIANLATTRSVDTAATPVDTNARTRHAGIAP